MAQPMDPTLRKMIDDARLCEKRGEWVEALDFYEEIDRRGAADADVLIHMGDCYLQLRQRQTARASWIRAFELDPTNQPVIQLLERNFRGWEKTLQHRRPEAAPPAPPPPSSMPSMPAPSQDSTRSLTVETIRRAPPTPPPAPPVEENEGLAAALDEHFGSQPASRPARRDARDSDAIDLEQTGSLRPTARPSRSVAGPAARPAPTGGGGKTGDAQLPAVNWDFVMADAMAESSHRK